MTVDSLLVEKLGRLHPLASLAPTALRQLAPLCRIERVARNLDPFCLRDWTGKAIFLFKGELKVDFADGGMSVLVGGAGEALLPLGGCGLQPVAAKTITDVELLYFDEDTLDIVLTWDQIMNSQQDLTPKTWDYNATNPPTPFPVPGKYKFI